MKKFIIIPIAIFVALAASSASAGDIATVTERKAPVVTTKDPATTRVICDEDFTEI